MIKTFRHKGLQQFFKKGSKKGIKAIHLKKVRLILARLNASSCPQDMNLPGLNLHQLKGEYLGFWAVSVSGNWRIIFKFDNQDAVDIDYLDYH